MFGYFFKALAIMGIIAAWSDKALADGKITAEEAFELLVKLADSLGLPLSFSLPELTDRFAAADKPDTPPLIDDDPRTRS